MTSHAIAGHAEYVDHPDCLACMQALKRQQNGIAHCHRETAHVRQTANVTCPWRCYRYTRDIVSARSTARIALQHAHRAKRCDNRPVVWQTAIESTLSWHSVTRRAPSPNEEKTHRRIVTLHTREEMRHNGSAPWRLPVNRASRTMWPEKLHCVPANGNAVALKAESKRARAECTRQTTAKQRCSAPQLTTVASVAKVAASRASSTRRERPEKTASSVRTDGNAEPSS